VETNKVGWNFLSLFLINGLGEEKCTADTENRVSLTIFHRK